MPFVGGWQLIGQKEEERWGRWGKKEKKKKKVDELSGVGINGKTKKKEKMGNGERIFSG